MDDERIERALRAGPPGEPAYQPLAPAVVAPVRRRGMLPSWLRVAGAAAAAVAVIAAVAVWRAGQVAPPDSGANLLTELREAGRVRIAVSSGSPQVEIPNAGFEGFDIDVARELGDRIGLRVEIAIVDPAEIAAGHWQGRWDLAIDSAVATGGRARQLLLGQGYYAKPATVVVTQDSPVTSLADLSGRRICVVPGSFGERWVSGTLDLIGGVTEPPPPGATAISTDAAGAIDSLGAGDCDAFVADWAYELGATPAGFRALAEAPFTGIAAPAVDPTRPGSDRLLVEVDRLVDEMRGDGTLGGLSQRRFGTDVTALPTQ
jgi:polar amino acid transport system substrate-binding protein